MDDVVPTAVVSNDAVATASRTRFDRPGLDAAALRESREILDRQHRILHRHPRGIALQSPSRLRRSVERKLQSVAPGGIA